MPSRSSRERFRQYRREVRERTFDPSSNGSPPASRPSKDGARPAAPQHPHGDRTKHRRSRSVFQLLGEFWGLIRPHRATIYVALATLSVSTLLGLAPLYGTKIVFDNILGDHPLPQRLIRFIALPADRGQLLGVVAVAMVLLAVGSELVSLWSRWNMTRATQLVRMSVRKQVFDHAVRLPLHRVYDLKSGGVASILREDAGAVADLIFSLLYNPWRAIIQLLGSVAVLAFVDWRLLLGSLVLLPIVWMTHRTWIGRIRPLMRDIRNTRQIIDAHTTEAFGGMRIVRSFVRQQHESGTFTRSGNFMSRQEVLTWWWMRGIDVAWSVLIPVATATLLYFGGRQVLADSERLKAHLITSEQALTVGDLVMFLAYLVALLGPIASLAASATGLQTSLAALDRVLDLMNEPREMPSTSTAVTLTKSQVQGRIVFKDVSFAYPAAKSGGSSLRDGKSTPENSEADAEPAVPALRDIDLDAAAEIAQSSKLIAHSCVLCDINLDVAAGQVIALVGPSGAGKTTLCNLVARFFDPTSGSIALDGRDIRDITIDSYRRLFGIVEQDTFLFDGTLAENIAYGRRNATHAEIEQAASSANAEEFIKNLSAGYETLIGERGVKLSAGQRQRITIARALLADPRILIFDEATSNLDTESERLIQASLQTLMQGRTSFVIAHRLSTIAHADRILVMEKGRIVEQGRHEELMQANSRYREMVLLQTSPPAPPRRAAPRVL
jgi:ATP-binding cassette subfamily B protein/subfamily B ATP-binding cassette protein MsbA